MGFQLVKPVINYSVRELCYRPYYNHPHGCPNYGHRETCPPKVGLIEDILDLKKDVFAIWNIFDFQSHTKNMKQKHPNWSIRQIECCLYWQPRARANLEMNILYFKVEYPKSRKYIFIRNPEALGVDITATMRSIGIELEWPPRIKTYQVALAGESFFKEVDHEV